MLYKHKEFILAEDEKQLHSLAKWLQYQFLSFQWLPKNDKSEEIHGANQTSALKSLSHPHTKKVFSPNVSPKYPMLFINTLKDINSILSSLVSRYTDSAADIFHRRNEPGTMGYTSYVVLIRERKPSLDYEKEKMLTIFHSVLKIHKMCLKIIAVMHSYLSAYEMRSC